TPTLRKRISSGTTLLHHDSETRYTEEPMIGGSTNWKRKTTGLLIVVFILGFLWTEAWAQMSEVNMGIAFVNARVAPLWVAEKEGFFRKNGIDIKLTNIPGGTQVAQALLSGGIDISFADPSSTISAIAAGAQLVEVMAITTIMPYYLVGAPEVKTVADLKGKRVGSSGLGLSASRLALLVAFGTLGLDPNRDKITLVAAGLEPERMLGWRPAQLPGRSLGRSIAVRLHSSASIFLPTCARSKFHGNRMPW